MYAWEFEKGGRELKVRVEGQLIFNGTNQMLNAALAGFGLAYVPEELVQPHLAKGRLKRVLEDWCPPYSGYHLYYPSRRQSSAAFALLVDALRYRRRSNHPVTSMDNSTSVGIYRALLPEGSMTAERQRPFSNQRVRRVLTRRDLAD